MLPANNIWVFLLLVSPYQYSVSRIRWQFPPVPSDAHTVSCHRRHSPGKSDLINELGSLSAKYKEQLTFCLLLGLLSLPELLQASVNLIDTEECSHLGIP